MKSIVTVLLLCLATSSWAQPTAAPGTEEIINALSTKQPIRFRNLNVIKTEGAAETPAAGQALPESPVAPPGGGSYAPADNGVAAPMAAPTAPAARPSISLSILFEFNSAKITQESQFVLRNLANALASQELRGNSFLIEGHTDAKGGDAYNMRLSQQRADAVRQWLVERGIAEQQLFALGRGSRDLALPQDPFAGENRRVRIVTVR
ncbi:OmpA family protein [Propionivibrio dicarboxylicus]|uniref:Outer membrane protein OmpA n=1 Tax=Propionivibrio dicarboxylicus TaxID=83767 RepID=A0A1G8A6R4_9RHOO|nr:OmpA family protein [Propionivibrio dicarboxylicus]SDH16618.1 Outer membrane protein OmpA [Propionivibrio dicarboxylicus]